jgi:dTDP-4-amino-4,6-dideoxygalactose transaminase
MIKRRKKQIGTGGSIITPSAKKLVGQVLDSGRLSYGPFLKKFEAKFAKKHGRKFAVTVNSGTGALLVAIQALKELENWKDGDEIIVPALTFIATSNVVLQNKLHPVFADIDAKTYNIDPRKIEKKITKYTRAIIPVHLFGLSAEMDEIVKIAKKHKLRIIEDSCEIAGVNYRSKPVGSMGDIACFSTYMAHLVTTGVGGLILTNDPQIAVKARSLVNHGRDSIYISMDDDKNKGGKRLAEIINRRFSFTSVGHSFRLTELEGALGIAQLKELPANIKKRQYFAKLLLKGLRPYKKFLYLPEWPKYSEHAFMMFPITIINKRIKRDELTQYLEEMNIETRPMFPILSQPIYRKLFGDIENQYPAAMRVNKDGFFIGCHPELKKSDIQYVIEVFADFFKKIKI